MSELNLAQAKEDALKEKGVGEHAMYQGLPHMVMERNGSRYLMPLTQKLPEAA